VDLAGLSQQLQHLKVRLASTTKKLLIAFLSSNKLIAQETLKRMRTGSAKITVWEVVEVDGCLLFGHL